MKKITFVLIFALVLSGFVFAEEMEEFSPISVDGGFGLTLEIGDNFVSEDSTGLDALAGFFNIFKGGVYIDGLYNFNEYLGAGLELGFYALPSEDGAVTALFDLPVLAIVEGNLFDIISVKGHVGYTLSSHLVIDDTDPIAYVNKLDIGARVILAGLYLDYSAMLWKDEEVNKHSTKWALGYQIKLL